MQLCQYWCLDRGFGATHGRCRAAWRTGAPVFAWRYSCLYSGISAFTGQALRASTCCCSVLSVRPRVGLSTGAGRCSLSPSVQLPKIIRDNRRELRSRHYAGLLSCSSDCQSLSDQGPTKLSLLHRLTSPRPFIQLSRSEVAGEGNSRSRGRHSLR